MILMLSLYDVQAYPLLSESFLVAFFFTRYPIWGEYQIQSVSVCVSMFVPVCLCVSVCVYLCFQ